MVKQVLNGYYRIVGLLDCYLVSDRKSRVFRSDTIYLICVISEICGWKLLKNTLTDKHHFPRLHHVRSPHTNEVYSGCEVACIEGCFVYPLFCFRIH